MFFPHTSGEPVSGPGGGHCFAKPTATQAMTLIPAWQEQTQMLPDSPTNVIISNKRLIGQPKMSFPLIKECSRKTKIATKHCQQSNQQRQLAVSSQAWAEPCAGSRACSCGFPNQHDSKSPGWQGRGEGRRVRGAAAACWLVGCCVAMEGDPMKNPTVTFQSSWKSAGYSPCCICHEWPFSTWNDATHSWQCISSLSASPLWGIHNSRARELSPFSTPIADFCLYYKVINSRSWEKYIKKQI